MRCQTFNAPLGAKPVMTLLGSVQATTLVVVMTMQKRKYTHLKAVEELILSMRQDGLTLREIADELGLSLKQMKNWSYRHNCENRNMLKGIVPKPKGRPRKDGQPPKQNMEKELQRLRMENKLLRDFLQSTGRK